MPHSPSRSSRHRRRHGSHRSPSPIAKSSRNRGYKSRREENSDKESRSRSPRRAKPKDRTTATAARASSPSEPCPAPPDITPLTADDYYNKNTEFRVWLLRKKKLYFDELSSRDNRRYFKDFVTRWNQGTLSARYYRGMTTAELPASSKTRHQWNFTKTASSSVASSSSHQGGSAGQGQLHGPFVAPPSGSENTDAPPTLDFRDKLLHDETQRQRQRDEARRQRRDLRKTHEMVLEEL
ncbi:hypothetical protein H4R35_005803, partial [Dimargaris xerosporica]